MITRYVSIIRPRVYVNCHRIHKLPPRFGKEVPNEDRMFFEKITPLIVGDK